MYARAMRVLVFFDLPTGTAKDRRQYATFRKSLVNDGFEMLQYSVYCRVTLNHDDAEKYIRRIRKYLPPKGSVRLMKITETQYQSMQILVGEQTSGERFLTPEDMLEI